MVERAHTLISKIGADTEQDLVREVRRFADAIERGELTAGVSGGYGSGSIYAYVHDPEMTHDEYVRQLEALIAKEQSKGE